jgi:signal transduction histidine kinase
LTGPAPADHSEQRRRELQDRSPQLDVLADAVHRFSSGIRTRRAARSEARSARFLAPAETSFVPRGGNNSWQDAGRRELLRGMQEARRGRPLGPLKDGLGPEMAAWVTRLREFYASLGMTLGELERVVEIDATTLSRYLKGHRLPEITFLGKLDDAVFSRTRSRMHQDVRESVRQLYLAACRVHDPHRHEVYLLQDTLAQAVERAEQAEEAVWDLRAELQAEQRRRERVENSLRQLEARAGTADDLASLRQERAQALAERDRLAALMERHTEQLRAALQEKYVIVRAREQLAAELHDAQQALDEQLENQWAAAEAQQPVEPAGGDTPSRRWWRPRARRERGSDLEALRERAESAALELPDVVTRLSSGEPLEAALSSLPSLSAGAYATEEAGRVGAALEALLREAVRLAGEQAVLRQNVSAMFTNLSRRSQVLIQRQLSLIVELESREADPDLLASLFRLDHLATRMRRNGENLLVLAGQEPGRRWTRPVPLVDVLRAAAAEVEQHERIVLSAVPEVDIAERAVNDLVHLVAELLENATDYSPPHTSVRVTGQALPDGRVLVEIHDAGLGLRPEDLAAINKQLANPPEADASVSLRMGLFVVGRLSLRHGIRTQLRPSDAHGVTALVMLPVDLDATAAGPPAAGPGVPGPPFSGPPN